MAMRPGRAFMLTREAQEAIGMSNFWERKQAREMIEAPQTSNLH